MRFSVPRSLSPSPERRRPATQRSMFGVPQDYSDDDDNSSNVSDGESIASSSTDSFVYSSPQRRQQSRSQPTSPLQTSKSGRPSLSIPDQYLMEDVTASIRLRVKHRDPYEDWENKTRKDAFVSARHNQSLTRSQLIQTQQTSHSKEQNRLAAIHNRQMQEVSAMMSKFKLAQQTEEQRMREIWKGRDKLLWDRVESVIKVEEEKLKVRLEEERRKREEEEKKKREAEEQKRIEEEKKKQHAEKLRLEAEARLKEKERERLEKERQEQMERERVAQAKAEEKERKALGMTTAEDDWKRAREGLKKLKVGPMKIVKSNKEWKSRWSAARRQITPKIGQLTNDAPTINRVSQQIVEICRPSPPYPEEIYYAILSSLSKAILNQAETEVTAEKRSAIPLAQVTVNLLWSLDSFPDIFWTKLCQRTGGWPVPYVVASTDYDGTTLTEEARVKALGYKSKEEPLSEYISRVSGIMRVYFHILFLETPKPLDPAFRTTRFWIYFSRILSQPNLLQSPVAPQILYAALDVGGSQALHIWGMQWEKLLALLYDGVTVGIYGTDKLVGGTSGEGTAARVRVQLEIERIMSGAINQG
ncbi:GLE1-like protein-domain-containing protein [Abortiporus biennis]|nr:GLE1-like protein-domain-containing protein [Abortiporus biennis]